MLDTTCENESDSGWLSNVEGRYEAAGLNIFVCFLGGSCESQPQILQQNTHRTLDGGRIPSVWQVVFRRLVENFPRRLHHANRWTAKQSILLLSYTARLF